MARWVLQVDAAMRLVFFIDCEDVGIAINPEMVKLVYPSEEDAGCTGIELLGEDGHISVKGTFDEVTARLMVKP